MLFLPGFWRESRRRFGGKIHAAPIAALVIAASGLAAQTVVAPAGSGGATAHYSLPFGNNPFLPSEARANFSGFLHQDAVPTAQWCGQCHTGVYKQWRESAHANSFRTPWYKKNVQLLIDEKGIAYSRHCEGCHNPIALFSGVLTKSSTAERPFDDEGVTCITCHSIQSVSSTRGLGSYVMGKPTVMLDEKGIAYSRHCEGCHNPVALFSGVLTKSSTAERPFDEEGVTCITCHSIQSVSSTRGLGSYVMGKPTVMLDEKGNPVEGLPSPDEIRAHPERHRAAMMRPVMQTPEFCGSCHKANLPESLNGYKWLRAFTTYDEWQQSGWSMTSPISFFPKTKAKTCQDCHMPRVSAEDVAAKANGVYSHRWAAANTAIPVQYGYNDQLDEVMRFLRANALRVDIFALSAGDGATAAPLDASSFVLGEAQPVTVSVVVQNTGIGHSLVPEQRDFYESWLAFEVRDENGRILYQSGAIDKDHRLDEDTHSYTNRILSGAGERLNHHEVWHVEARAYDSTVSAGRADLERYCFTIPAGVKTVTLHAAVKYRRFRREFVDWVFDDTAARADRFPTATMAEDTVTLHVGANRLQTEHTSTAAPLLRWTAYGIGLMDKQQVKQAIAVFETTARLYPKRVDGYLNTGVALYTDGRFDEALAWLAKADKMEPENLRSRYYEGLCYRWQYKYAQATEKLTAVAAAYPRFRQVHDDLGWIYLLERRYPNARAEFEAAVDVDPDDLTAHKWLGSVYTALGDRQRAAEEAERTAQLKDDPAAQWRVLAYWREHQEVAREVAPGHIHGEDMAGRAEVKQMLNTQNPPDLIWIQR